MCSRQPVIPMDHGSQTLPATCALVLVLPQVKHMMHNNVIITLIFTTEMQNLNTAIVTAIVISTVIIVSSVLIIIVIGCVCVCRWFGNKHKAKGLDESTRSQATSV